MKRSDIIGNPFEWLLGENNVIKVPLPILHCIILLGENIAGQHGQSQNNKLEDSPFLFTKTGDVSHPAA